MASASLSPSAQEFWFGLPMTLQILYISSTSLQDRNSKA